MKKIILLQILLVVLFFESMATIVVSGNVLRTVSGNSQEIIQYIELFEFNSNNKVFSTEGCFKQECLFDVSSLPEGTYRMNLKIVNPKSGVIRMYEELVVIDR